MASYRVGVVGCGGRMGRMLLQALHEDPSCEIAGGSERAGSPLIGGDLGSAAGLAPLGLNVVDDAREVFRSAEAVLDFTLPKVSVEHAEMAASHGRVHIIGTTGLDAPQEAALAEAGRAGATIVYAANMSLGVNLLLAMVEFAASKLADDFDIEVVEMHHRHKVDAPSGTALALGRAAAAGRDVDLDKVAQKVRDGITGPRRRGDIGFATLRGGDVTGEHSVIFAADGERIILSHRASHRGLFAKGAVRAALWARDKAPGLYSMRDVLGLGERAQRRPTP